MSKGYVLIGAACYHKGFTIKSDQRHETYGRPKRFRVKKSRGAHINMMGLGMVKPDLTPVPRPDVHRGPSIAKSSGHDGLYVVNSSVHWKRTWPESNQNLPLKSAEPECLNGGLPSVMCGVWCHCVYSFDFHHSSPLKREYVTAAVTFKKSSFEATFWLLPSLSVCTVQRRKPSSQLASLFYEFYSKCIRNIWTRDQVSKLPSLPYPPRHISSSCDI